MEGQARISKYPVRWTFMTKLVFRVISNGIFTFLTEDLPWNTHRKVKESSLKECLSSSVGHNTLF